ncbi:hypothetical protein REPUB_Repub12eG0193400 [Reevesia pubescens]
MWNCFNVILRSSKSYLFTRVDLLVVLRGFLSMLPLHNRWIGQEPDGAVTRRYGLLLIFTVFSFFFILFFFPYLFLY